jgi:acyl-CoA reductase-like NAD-dependent aldehyde dehydrogenase
VQLHCAVQFSLLELRSAHKTFPALAVGCPCDEAFASRTPLGAILIGEILPRPTCRRGLLRSCKLAHRDGADLFTTDDRLKLLSFTDHLMPST